MNNVYIYIYFLTSNSSINSIKIAITYPVFPNSHCHFPDAINLKSFLCVSCHIYLHI